jgi:hypothetical protein
MDAPTPGVATITSQVETFDVTDRGTAEAGTRVYFTTAKGNRGSVFVPRDAFTTDNVFAAVKERAQQMDAIHGAVVA